MRTKIPWVTFVSGCSDYASVYHLLVGCGFSSLLRGILPIHTRAHCLFRMSFWRTRVSFSFESLGVRLESRLRFFSLLCFVSCFARPSCFSSLNLLILCLSRCRPLSFRGDRRIFSCVSVRMAWCVHEEFLEWFQVHVECFAVFLLLHRMWSRK